MRHLSDECPERHGAPHAQTLESIHQLGGEHLPSVVGLFTQDHDQILDRIVHDMDLVPGPVDGANTRTVESHHRAPHLEVEVLVRVDDGDQVASQAVQEARSRLAGRFSRVSPALEGENGDGIAQDRSIDPMERGHIRNLHPS